MQSLLFRSLPIFLSCSMFVITVAGGGQLTASAVFTTLALADTLRAPLSQLSDLLSELVNAHASLHSVQAFLALQGQVGPGGCSGSGPHWQAAGDRMPRHGASTLETVGIAGGGIEGSRWVPSGSGTSYSVMVVSRSNAGRGTRWLSRSSESLEGWVLIAAPSKSESDTHCSSMDPLPQSLMY